VSTNEPKSVETDEHDEKAREKVLEIARSMHMCMVTVADGTGALLSRPMTPLEVTDEGEILFLIDTTAGQASQVTAHPAVNLAFVEGSKWLSISGRGKVIRDPALVKELWNPAAEAWFPDGPEDSRLGVLRVRGKSAEYWDTPGGRIATVLSFIKAKATGNAMDADNETVRLR